MEFVALSDNVLPTLALEDRQLGRVFHAAYPADQLPRSPPTSVRQAYIVNTDPAGEPGQHWLGLWTEQNKCEVFDSYGLPLHVYTNPDLHQWWRQWKHLIRSDMTLKAMDSQTCGHYALFNLKARAQGQSYQEFLSQWSCDNLVLNDHKVVERLKRVIKQELQDEVDARPDGQKNVSRQAFMFCNPCDY